MNNTGSVDVKTRRKWMQIWLSVEKQFSALPTWVQDTILEDITTAVENRVAVMRHLQMVSA